MGLIDELCGRVVWPLWARRDHPRLWEFVKEISKRQFDPPEVRKARQEVMLQRTVRHAATTVPYYRDLFAQLQLSPEEIRTVADLQALPILTKTDIRQNADALVSDEFRNRPTVTKSTSGSSGVPLEIRLDLGGLAWKRAATIVADQLSGWRPGRRVAQLWGSSGHENHGWKSWFRNRLFDRAIQLNTLNMTEADIEQFARRLVRFRPSLLFGHAHSLALLAATIRDKHLPTHRPDGVISTAMMLPEYQRKLIQEVFGCRVINRYGCEEVSLIACECSEQSGFHINDHSILMELLDGDRPAASGQSGRVVITDLSNFAMPLLRYEIGDIAEWAEKPCPCGRGSAMLASVVGRDADFVVTPSGQYISGISLTDHLATLIPGVAQMQIVQEAIDRLCFRLVGVDRAVEPRIAALVRERFGPAVTFRCEYVATIPRESSGKYRFCISHVRRGAGQAA